jgi:hypothetical protein
MERLYLQIFFVDFHIITISTLSHQAIGNANEIDLLHTNVIMKTILSSQAHSLWKHTKKLSFRYLNGVNTCPALP